ncbi:Ferric iron ABC transporter, iron-binding protein, partial [hydrothermal vent metagenome]
MPADDSACYDSLRGFPYYYSIISDLIMSKKLIGLFVFLLSTTFTPVLFAAEKVTLYSSHEAAAIQPLLERFTKDTGIQVDLVNGTEEQLIQRLKTEKGDAAADIFLGADVVQLQRAEKTDLLQSVTSEALKAVPPSYRDSAGYWYGLSMFVRPIFYPKSDIDPFEFYGYEQMAKPEWKGRICVSSSDNPYNQSLVASMITSRGKEATQKWLTTFVGNLARPPQGDDRDQLIAISTGVCDIALANTYLYGQMSASEDEAERQAVDDLGMLWANQPGRGVHANFRGAGVNVHAPHRANAIKL